ncbi:MAG: hypothetical protein ACKVPX_14120 [Myxococcaceae bacterium]
MSVPPVSSSSVFGSAGPFSLSKAKLGGAAITAAAIAVIGDRLGASRSAIAGAEAVTKLMLGVDDAQIAQMAALARRHLKPQSELPLDAVKPIVDAFERTFADNPPRTAAEAADRSTGLLKAIYQVAQAKAVPGLGIIKELSDMISAMPSPSESGR